MNNNLKASHIKLIITVISLITAVISGFVAFTQFGVAQTKAGEVEEKIRIVEQLRASESELRASKLKLNSEIEDINADLKIRTQKLTSIQEEINKKINEKNKATIAQIENLIIPMATAWKKENGFGLNLFITFTENSSDNVKNNIKRVVYQIDGREITSLEKAQPYYKDTSFWWLNKKLKALPNNLKAIVFFKLGGSKEFIIEVPHVRKKWALW